MEVVIERPVGRGQIQVQERGCADGDGDGFTKKRSFEGFFKTSSGSEIKHGVGVDRST